MREIAWLYDSGIDNPHLARSLMTSMLIIGTPIEREAFLDHLFATSVRLLADARNDWVVTLRDEAYLDPGGMARAEPECATFTLDGLKFKVDWEKIGQTLYLFDDYAKERAPGTMVVPQFAWRLVLPNELFSDLKSILSRLEKSDEALHAELDFDSLRRELRDFQQKKREGAE